MARRFPALVLAALGAAACSQADPCSVDSGARWLAYASAESGSWNVYAIHADGTCRRAISSDSSFETNPACGRGAAVAYESDRAPFTSIWLHDVRFGIERRVDVAELRASSPAFSPDGTTLAFEGRLPTEAMSSVYLVPVQGGAPVPLVPGTATYANGGPVFSPDGATVYFVSNRTGVYDVFEVPVAGGDPTQVTTGSGILGKPTISPDGKTLAYTRLAGASTEVVLYDLASGATTPLGIATAAEPAFDPSGGRLAIRVFYGSSANVDLVSLADGSRTSVTTGPGPDGAPAFAPAGW